ncbi:MAG: hypothetical protein R2861_04570 [Desulfobacterales bacterium]
MKSVFAFVTALLCCASFVFAEEAVTLPEIVMTATGSEKESFNTSLPVNVIETHELDETILSQWRRFSGKNPGGR